MKLTSVTPGKTGIVNLIPSEGWTLTRLTLSRTGDVVEIEGRLNPAGTTVGRARNELSALAEIPLGFRPRLIIGSRYPAGQAYILVGSGVGEVGTMLFADGKGLSVRMVPSADRPWSVNDHLLVHGLWRTTDPFPPPAS